MKENFQLKSIRKKIIGMAFFALTVVPTPVCAQTPLPSPTENQGSTNATTIIEGAINGSKYVVSSFDKDWKDLSEGKSPVYTAVVKMSLLMGTILISFWGIGWYKEFLSGNLIKVIDEAIYPVIVIVMLVTNNGALLVSSSLFLRSISVYTNQQILGITRNGIRFNEAIREVNMDQAFASVVHEKLKDCEKLSPTLIDSSNSTNPQETCKNKVLTDASAQARQYREKYQLPAYANSINPLDWGKGFFNSAVQSLMWSMFSTFESIFQYGIQVCFLLNVYVGPIFLVLSLLPLGAKSIYAWLSGWVALGITLCCYSIMVGIAATSVVNSPNTNPLFFQLIEAVLSPVLAVALGAGGGLGLFIGFSSSAAFFLTK